MLPVRNRFVIALEGTALGFLTTPAETVQQAPHARGLVADPKEVPDHVRNTLQGPVVFGVALPIGPLLQRVEQALTLCGRQATGTPW
jgi:hypothetical protein